MKRSQPLTRRTPLKSGGSLKRSAPMKRSSARLKIKRRGIPADLREQVIARDRGCAAEGLVPSLRCWGRLDPHHIQRRSQGGADSLQNLITLCRAHHDYVHANPAWSAEQGLLARRKSEAPR